MLIVAKQGVHYLLTLKYCAAIAAQHFSAARNGKKTETSNEMKTAPCHRRCQLIFKTSDNLHNTAQAIETLFHTNYLQIEVKLYL